MAKIIGIDLGTTNSCVSVMEGGEPQVIRESYLAWDIAVDADHVYMAFCTPEKLTVMAFEKAEGAEVWRRELAGPFEGDHNFGSSPILFEDLLILQARDVLATVK